MKRLLIIPHLFVQNANAQSSPYTIGFPAMTAFLGATHAFQRILSKRYPEFRVISTGVVCHSMELHTHKGYGDFVHSVINTANPIKKDGTRPSFIEEPKCSLDISLIMEIAGMPFGIEEQKFLQIASSTLDSKMRIAGGDILGYQSLMYESVDPGDVASFARFKQLLMPGYALVERRDLMIQEMKDGHDALDALLNCMKIYHTCDQSEDGTVEWQSKRKYPGWLVPVAVGYQGISELGEVSRQREPTVPHRFAEAIVTLGEFVMPYRLKEVDKLLWHYEVDQENVLYLCRQQNN